MTKLSYKQVIEQTVELEVPDEYTYDESLRGQIADIIADVSNHKLGLRDDLFSDEKYVIMNAIERLKDAYKKADAILELIKKQS